MGKVIAGFIAIVVGIVGVGFLFFSTRYSTAPDEVGLHYSAGPLSSTKFEECILPSNRVWNGPADQHFTYPAGQRTFTFASGEASDSGPIVALTKDNIELTTSGVVGFELNIDCAVLQEFHEKIGLKFGNDADGVGWRSLLNTYLQQSLQRAVNDATQDLEWRELYNDSTVKTAWENSVKTKLPVYVRQAMGGDYFQNFSVTIQKPDLPIDLADALRATQVAVEQNNAQKQQNARVETETESIKRLVEILGPDGYNTYQAIKDGRVSVYPIPQGSSVMINGEAAKSAVETDQG